MIIQGDDIKRLIPQRDPFMMVDEFEQQNETSACSALTIARGNYFLLPDGMIAPTGLIEHIAQSCHRRPQLNERIQTEVSFGFSFGNMTLAHGVSKVADETVAEVDLKIFMQ